MRAKQDLSVWLLASVSVVVLELVLVAGCHPEPPIHPEPAVLDGAPPVTVVPTAPECLAMCGALREHQCPEGSPPAGQDTCEALCSTLRAEGHHPMPAWCVAGASTVEAIRACGYVRCIGGR